MAEGMSYDPRIDELIVEQYQLEQAMSRRPTEAILQYAHLRATQRLDFLTNGQTIFHDMAMDSLD